jgi:hypothetical protein
MKHIADQDNFYDFLKHLATLATGSVVLLAAFAEKFPKDASWRFLLGYSMGAFLVSIFSSIVCAFCSLGFKTYEVHDEPDKKVLKIIFISFLVTAVFLLAGLLSLGIFAIKNF